jgi:hypothetical protein
VKTIGTLVFTLILSCFSAVAKVYDSDGSLANVQAIHNNSATVDGDTIVIPAGNFDWTGIFTASKAITLQGQGNQTTDVSNITTHGQYIRWALHQSNFTTRITGLHFHAAESTGRTWIVIGPGSATMKTVGGRATGGIRVDHNHFTAANNAAQNSPQFRSLPGTWADGVFDHNFLDYDQSWGGTEIFSIGADAQPPSGTFDRGAYSWYTPYVPGGDPLSGSSFAFYFEDNVIHRMGGWLDMNNAGNRYVVRYNVLWGHVGGHGVDSGGSLGGRIKEVYNNAFRWPPGAHSSISGITNRGGAGIYHNNRFSGISTTKIGPVGMFRLGGNSSYVGVGDGTNFYDLNARDNPLNYNGTSFPAITPLPPDPRTGAIYATGNQSVAISNNTYKLIGLDGGPTANKWKGFTYRNATKMPPESAGGQTNIQYQFGTIDTSTAGPDSTITMAGPSIAAPIPPEPTDVWEIRRVRQAFCGVGAGASGLRLGNSTRGRKRRKSNGPGQFPLFVDPNNTGTPLPPSNPRWSNQEAIGVWQWENKDRANSDSGAFTIIPFMGANPDSGRQRVTVGGTHNNVGAPPGYPTISDPARRRIGSDWNAPGFNETFAAGDPNSAMNGMWGAVVYPHPLVTGEPTPAPGAITKSQQHQKKAKKAKKRRGKGPRKLGK